MRIYKSICIYTVRTRDMYKIGARREFVTFGRQLIGEPHPQYTIEEGDDRNWPTPVSGQRNDGEYI